MSKGLLDDIETWVPDPDHAKVLIHGEPGTGKTSILATMLELGKCLYLYVRGEEGIGSLPLGHPNLVVYRLGDKTGNPITELEQFYVELYKGDHDYVCVMVESVSALQTQWKKHIGNVPFDSRSDGKTRPKTDFDYWGGVGEAFIDFFTFWYGLASSRNPHPIHVVMTSQTKAIEDDEDDEESMKKMQPDLHKTPLGAARAVPDHILYTFMSEGEDLNDDGWHPAVRVKPTDRVVAKTRCEREVSDMLPEVMGLKNPFSLPAYLKATKRVAGV